MKTSRTSKTSKPLHYVAPIRGQSCRLLPAYKMCRMRNGTREWDNCLEVAATKGRGQRVVSEGRPQTKRLTGGGGARPAQKVSLERHDVRRKESEMARAVGRAIGFFECVPCKPVWWDAGLRTGLDTPWFKLHLHCYWVGLNATAIAKRQNVEVMGGVIFTADCLLDV